MTPLPPSLRRAPTRRGAARRPMAWLALPLWCWFAAGVTAAAAPLAAPGGRIDGPALPAADSVPNLGPGAPAPPSAPEHRAAQEGGPGCAAWTDRCVSCERRPEGRVSCSNIGIACQPQAVQCVRGETAQEPKSPDANKEEN